MPRPPFVLVVLEGFQFQAGVEGVASNGVLGESRPKGMLANTSLVCITSGLRVNRAPLRRR